MRRRLCSALSVLSLTAGLLLVAGTAADAAAVTTTVGGVTYRADDAAPAAGAAVTSVAGTAPKNLAIPATVTIAGTPYAVTSVAADAAGVLDLTSLTLPGSVTSIGNGAFVGNRLTSLTLPASLQTIGEGAFAGNQLTSLALPAALRVIDSGAFVTNELTTVTIPASVTVVDDAAFADNPLSIVRFTGPAPTTFTPATPAAGSPIGSLGDGNGLVVFYPAQLGAPTVAGGYTSPLWQRYTAQAVGTVTPTPTPPGTTPTTPTTPGTTAGQPRPTITGVTVRRKPSGLAVFRVTVTNRGSATARGVRVIFKNRPRSVTFPKPTAWIGTLPAGRTETVKVAAEIRSRTRTKFILKALSDNAPRSTFRVRLKPR